MALRTPLTRQQRARTGLPWAGCFLSIVGASPLTFPWSAMIRDPCNRFTFGGLGIFGTPAHLADESSPN